MPLPTFAIIGAAKSGTTALHHYLAQHPQIHIPDREEPSHFAFPGTPPRLRGPGATWASVNATAVSSREAYEHLFDGAGGDQARGDVSPAYLYWPGTAERMVDAVPDIRVVAVLRHPVDRAHSAFVHARREGREPLPDLRAALAAEPSRIQEGYGLLWRYRDLGRYGEQVARWRAVLGAAQLLLCPYEDLLVDPVALCQRIQSFIGVDPTFAPDTAVRHNPSGIPRSRAAYRLLGSGSPVGRAGHHLAPLVGRDRLHRAQIRMRGRLLQPQPLDAGLRAALVQEWQEDIQAAVAVLDRDPGHWAAEVRRVP